MPAKKRARRGGALLSREERGSGCGAPALQRGLLPADPQLIRYDARMTTSVLDDNGKPVPTLSWQPLPGFGARPGVAFDRYMIEGEFDRTLRVTLGRFPRPYTGTEMLFDYDYHFQGISESVRLDRLLPDGARRYLPRIELVGVQGYMAQNNLGLPTALSDTQPIYLGTQFRLDLAPTEGLPAHRLLAALYERRDRPVGLGHVRVAFRYRASLVRR